MKTFYFICLTFALSIFSFRFFENGSFAFSSLSAQSDPDSKTPSNSNEQENKNSKSLKKNENGPNGPKTKNPKKTASIPTELLPKLETKLLPTKGPKSTLFTGDSLQLVIEAIADPSHELSVTKQNFPKFEVLDRSVTQNPHDKNQRDLGKKVYVFSLTLLALEPGPQIISPIKIRVLTEEGILGFVETQPFEIRVQSHLANEPNAQPKPWSAPVEVLQEDLTLLWLLVGLAAIVLIVLLTLLIRTWWMKRPQNKYTPPPIPPWELAIEQITQLRKEGPKMLEQGLTVEWIDRLSDSLRQYLGGRFGFDGLESTTDEVAEKLQSLPLQGITHPEVTSILAECDLVKFAKAQIDIHQCVRMLDGVEGIVRRSIPNVTTSIAPSDSQTPIKAEKRVTHPQTSQIPTSEHPSAHTENPSARTKPLSDEVATSDTSDSENDWTGGTSS